MQGIHPTSLTPEVRLVVERCALLGVANFYETQRRQLIPIKSINKRRFEALAGYTRQPGIILIVEEIIWLATEDERLIGIVTFDRIDFDFGWVVLGRDERLRFRAVAVDASLSTAEESETKLRERMRALWAEPDESFHQGDASGTPVNFFELRVPVDRLHPFFRKLAGDELYSPARDIVSAMMRFHEDVDGNFVEQFQTTAFDARLWELYLFAVFTELGYARTSDIAVPDFVLTGLRGRLSVEATTINPPQAGEIPRPRNEADFFAYLENYVPIKMARALKRKLNRQPPYWELPQMDNVPFVLAIQDFHGPGVMRMIPHVATEYVFGVRHSIVNGVRKIERIVEHKYGRSVEPSGFFSQPRSENVSAVILNAQGTITKFNRLGYIAGFGSRRIRMTQTGLRRGEQDPSDPAPKTFLREVHDPGFDESWIEGMIVLHNPRARIPLDPLQLEGAAHEFLQPDGSIMSMLPEFHPHFSQTNITLVPDSNV